MLLKYPVMVPTIRELATNPSAIVGRLPSYVRVAMRSLGPVGESETLSTTILARRSFPDGHTLREQEDG